jgi:hypothetical protein
MVDGTTPEDTAVEKVQEKQPENGSIRNSLKAEVRVSTVAAIEDDKEVLSLSTCYMTPNGRLVVVSDATI